jgi:hypothetical protein
MDRERFDAIARLFADTRSRRRALGLLLGVGLLAPHSTLKETGQGHNGGECKTDCPPDPRSGKPGFLCPDGSCSCGGKCCADQCFYDFGGTSQPVAEFCCTGPKLDFCPSKVLGADPACCRHDAEDPCSCLGPGAITGSYRRR